MSSLINSETKIKVSSTLNRDVRAYGKQFLTDGSDETCWNSDQGSPQYIVVDFSNNPHSAVRIEKLELMFQGGFAGKQCELLGVHSSQTNADESWAKVMDFYPEDNNSLQTFPAPATASSYKRLRIVFKDSTDFYGRVTLYTLRIIGERINTDI